MSENILLTKIQALFVQGEYALAEKTIDEIRGDFNLYTDLVAVYDANISLAQENHEKMWFAIQRGLLYNYKNYELYVLLGEYYIRFRANPNQAYLCYENALFYCTDSEDSVFIQDCMNRLTDSYTITVPKTSFIILSYNLLDYTRDCIESIRNTVPESAREIVVVDNASQDGSVEWLRAQPDIILRENPVNSGFPKGCNEGVECASKENDIFLLNNDTVLTPNSLFWLRMGLYESDLHGATGSISNHVSNAQMVIFKEPTLENYFSFAKETNIPMQFPYEEKLYLVGFALLIKRSVFDQVGPLDERFSPGNYEDTDYGLRVITAGYKNLLCKNSFIIHHGSKSFGKNVTTFNNVLQINAEKFKQKWDINPHYYLHPRLELVRQVTEARTSQLNILDIGCGCGALSAALKGVYPNAATYGVEIVPSAANIAKHIGSVICGDIETIEFPWPENFFDYIVMGDVLEHLHEPAIVLQKLYKHIKTGGHIIVSMPNMKHYSVMLPLIIDDEFSYSDAGILDRTHLKMYTKTEIFKLITDSNYEIEEFSFTSCGEPTPATMKFLHLLNNLSRSKDINTYLAYQYIVKAKK